MKVWLAKWEVMLKRLFMYGITEKVFSSKEAAEAWIREAQYNEIEAYLEVNNREDEIDDIEIYWDEYLAQARRGRDKWTFKFKWSIQEMEVHE